MKPSVFVLTTTMVVTAAAASGQTVRPESLSYMSRLFRLNNVPDNPRYSPDGKWLAFEGRSSAGTPWRLFVVPSKGGTPTPITAGGQSEQRPMWSAAGDRLVFYSREGSGAVMTIAIDPATGHAVGAVKRVTIDSLRGASYDISPDGRNVAYLTPTAADRYDLRIVPISGGPSKTLASLDGVANGLRYDRDGSHLYFFVQRNGPAPEKGQVRDVKRIASSGGSPTTVFTIPAGLMGVQLDPAANRVLIRDGDRGLVLTLAGDSVAVIPWAQGFRTVSTMCFSVDGSALVSFVDATQSSIHVVPLDGGAPHAITDGSGYPWPDYWLGEHIFVSDANHAVETLYTADGKKRPILFDVRKANDGIPAKVVENDPFPDAVHFIVKTLDAAGDTSLFVYDSRTGDARRIVQKLTGSRVFAASGPGDDYLPALGNEYLYRNVRNGVAEIHALDVSGRDRLVQSFPMPKQRETIAFAPERTAHSYERGDTAYIDVTIGSAKPLHALVRPGVHIGEMVFTRDGSSLYADVITGTGPTSRTRGAFFSTVDDRSLKLPPRWIETVDCWHPTWLPNGSGVLEFCVNEGGTRTWVSRMPASGPATPQPLTQHETSVFWDYAMSPDGKYVAVPAEKNSGANAWRIDLRAAAKERVSP